MSYKYTLSTVLDKSFGQKYSVVIVVFLSNKYTVINARVSGGEKKLKGWKKQNEKLNGTKNKKISRDWLQKLYT